DWAIRAVLLVGLPAAVVLALLSGPMLSTLFQHGIFNGHSVIMASQSLSAFAVGIAPFMLVKILASGFYARQDMRTPVKIGVVAMLSNIMLNVALIYPLKHMGIALATSLSAIVNMSCLYYFLRQHGHYAPRDGWGLFAIRLFTANVVLAAWLWYGTDNIQIWIDAATMWRVTHLAFLLGTSVVLYFAVLWITGIRPHDLLIPQKHLAAESK
ncbi:MAG TPA: lipid II flippase MurJ, partial [Gammaproteobacteria bacterium]|nr:lipid II flippase MurJ [Gammaproteobacteria bacterium]